ncbi:uncharacterized protein LOC105251663 isoform X2 [Camponotus floridanus]|uniref:uncharacterized protein LOC105251663 isoform X2 n=1 Tax=Camponotus floridanus TaxID=104421 RepID=UPI00059C7317|nr:uncharacterized protein LOC105251663 isoform X2 [Camponotus floridanus]
MVKLKMLFLLFCVLLIGQHVQAVVNKATSPLAKEEEKPTKAKADDRISNTFNSPSDEYGPPLGSSFNGPAPIYGPPELVGSLGSTPIYPPPPPELPPPVFGPSAVSYGPPRSIKPQYGPPKQSFGLAISSLLSKPTYGPPKLHYGPPKQHFMPPLASFSQFISPKPQYGLPLKSFVGTSSQQYISPLPTSQHGPSKPGHGPPIPISLETYGPPPPKLAIQFNPLPNDEYGPPPPPVSAPQPQYGPPAGDLYGPPPPAPPPGVPAPPTPPDIKYDGWQPIAGVATSPNQSGPPIDTYASPLDAKHNYIESSSSSGSQLSHASLSASTNTNIPSDSYGMPLNNPDDHDLKTSVHESSASSENDGLPPPPLPQHEPLHNNHGPGATTSQSDHQFGRQQLNLQHGTPNIEPLTIVKTVGFELLPTTGALNGDLTGLSLSGGTSDVSSFNHISNSINANSASLHSELTSNDGSHAAALSNGGDSHGFQNVENDLSLQQLPQQTPSNDYGPPLTTVTFGKPANFISSTSLFSPPPLDSYGTPPLSSYSFTGPYPAAQGGRLFSSFGTFGSSFNKQNLHHHRVHGPFRPPPIPLESLMPPRNREPIKFREPIPTGLLSNINRYLSPPTKQQLPIVHAPVSFRHTHGSSNSFSGSFASSGSFNVHNSPIAAPHVQYGTPLSFTDFNTPAPHLTYGAPNFGPPTSFVSTSSGFGSNLYSGINNALTTYGTPVVNAPLSIGGGYDCNSLQPLLPVNGALHSNKGLSVSGELPLSGSLASSGESHSSGELHLSGGLSLGGEVPSGERLLLDAGLPAHGGAHGGAHSNGQLQLGFENVKISGGSVENPSPLFINSLSTSIANSVGSDLSGDSHQNSIFTGNSLPLIKPLDNFLGGPPVNTLDLQHNEQQKTNLKDSYGNPVGLTYDSSNEASDTRAVHASTKDISNEPSAHPSSQSHNSAATLEHGSGISAAALTARLTAQAFGQQKNLELNEVDASQFLKSSEGSEALSLAQRLTADNANDFEIHGSKGTYRLQIQAADGGLGTENSDGSIRHDQVLSNGLLQDIIAAIEQPENGAIQLQGSPQVQQLEKVFGPDLPQETGVINGHFITVDNQGQSNGLQNQVEEASERSEDVKYSKNQPSIALFFDTKFGETKKEIRSASKSEMHTVKEKEQNNSKTKSFSKS